MKRNNHSKDTSLKEKLKAIIEHAIIGKNDLVLLEHFTAVSHSYTDEYSYAVVDKNMQCIYLLAETVSSLNEQELIARARHIPTVYGYLFYLSEESQLALDGEFKVVQDYPASLSISYIDFESSFKNWRKDPNINIKTLVRDLRNSLRTKYGVSNDMAELLVCSSRNTLLKKAPFNSIFINKAVISGSKPLYRYLSNEAFFRIINSSDKSQRTLTYGLSSICSMNDRWEYSYGTDLNGNQIFFRDSGVQDTHIMSLSEVSPCNSLDMWRLYGEDAKGICLEFEVAPKAPVYKINYKKNYYGEPHYPYYVEDRYGNKYAFPLTSHNPIQLFSQKSKEYEVEKEARLIIVNRNNYLLSRTSSSPESVHIKSGKWVNSSGTPFPILMMEKCKQDDNSYPAPLILKRVFIGPNASDSALKKAMIIKRLAEFGINIPIEIVKDFGYKPTK